MKFIELTATLRDEKILVNLDNVAEIVVKDDGCLIYYVTPDGQEEQVARKVKEPIESILGKIPEGSVL